MTEKEEKNNSQDNSSAPDDDLESLSEDEKAAFEKILAEINAGDQNPEDDARIETPEPSSAADDSDDALSDDQQAALDKIMSEINARDQKPEDDAGTEQDPEAIDEDSPAQEKSAKIDDKLSFDEFNNELDNLLTQAQQNVAEESPASASSGEDKPQSKPTVEKAANIPPTDLSSLKYGPAPQHSDPSPTADGTNQEEDPADSPSDPGEKSQPAYAVLQEIDPDQSVKTDSFRKKRPKKTQKERSGLLFKIASAALAVLATVGLIYWGLSRWDREPTRKPASASQPPVAQSSSDSGTLEITTGLKPAPVASAEPVETTAEPSRKPDGTSLGSLASDLSVARKQIATKIDEITNLIAYYEEGIKEESHKIQTVLQNQPIPSLDKALANNQIELCIRAIQRRHAYISKLGEPLEHLKASSEELLFLERRTQLFETLNQYIGAPSIPQYKQEIAERIQINIQTIKELSVDNSQMDLPSKASVWEEVRAGLEMEKALAAQRSRTNKRDNMISQEICNGEFDRKYLLTHLSEKAASCLVRWNGKDLYLNGLTDLSPQTASILAQWPGEWLSLNGIKELSAETAKYLSRWPGKRLSLNGLERLSPQATAELSKWQGEQLEMVGLTAIGPWENYATRLYLSESLRRKLQM